MDQIRLCLDSDDDVSHPHLARYFYHQVRSTAGEMKSGAVVYNTAMQESPLESFLRSLFVFLLFISISFGVAFGVSTYTTHQTAAANQAAALKALVGEK